MFDNNEYSIYKKAHKDICNILSPPNFTLPQALQALQTIYCAYIDKGLQKELFEGEEYIEAIKKVKESIKNASNIIVNKHIQQMRDTIKKAEDKRGLKDYETFEI